MKLKVVDVKDSSDKRVEVESGKCIGIFCLDISGFYYLDPKGEGWYEAHTLRQIADLLDEINKPYKEQVDKYFEDNLGKVDPLTGIIY